jgi:hypothetical protein
MRWRNAWGVALSAVGLMGCPETFGKGGTVDQAVFEDAVDAVNPERCPPPEEVRAICANPKKQCPEECPR